MQNSKVLKIPLFEAGQVFKALVSFMPDRFTFAYPILM